MYFSRSSRDINGIHVSEPEAYAILDTANETGINFIDTADTYGSGSSEEIVGKWLHSRKCRKKIILGTKFGLLNSADWEIKKTRNFIIHALESSLKRLNTDYIDLYQVHIQKTEESEEELLSILQELVNRGKILHYGVSNYTAYRLAKSNCLSDQLGFNGYTTLQAQYNLINRSIEREHVPLLLTENMKLLAWSPLAGGMLTGKYTEKTALPINSRYSTRRNMFTQLYDNPRCWNIVNTIRDMQEELNIPSSTIALSWLLAQKVVASVIVGISHREQLLDNIIAATYVLSKANLDRLNNCSSFEYGYPYEGIARCSGKW